MVNLVALFLYRRQNGWYFGLAIATCYACFPLGGRVSGVQVKDLALRAQFFLEKPGNFFAGGPHLTIVQTHPAVYREKNISGIFSDTGFAAFSPDPAPCPYFDLVGVDRFPGRDCFGSFIGFWRRKNI